MSIFGDMHKRIKGNSVRKEDDRTSLVKDFVDSHGIKSFNISNDQTEWYLDVDGDVHIYPQDIYSDGTLGFKLVNVSGNLISHCRCICPAIVPTNLGGNITFDVESLMDKQPVLSSPAVPSPTQQVGEPDVPDGMELLRSKPMSKEEIQKKMESLISECIKQGYEIDLDSIRQSIEKDKNNSGNYQLRIEIEYTDEFHKSKNSALKRCDIYISDDDNDILDLTAIQKATYLTFLLYEDGVLLDCIKKDFVEKMKSIYRRLPNKVIDDNNSILEGMFSTSTLNGYRSEIRNAIKDRITYNDLIDDFAIEGYKDKPYKIRKSTPKIREQITEIFLLSN